MQIESRYERATAKERSGKRQVKLPGKPTHYSTSDNPVAIAKRIKLDKIERRLKTVSNV
jgi:hypothetical protein